MNSVQPYCRLAIVTRQTMPRTSWPHRVHPDVTVRTSDLADVVAISIPNPCCRPSRAALRPPMDDDVSQGSRLPVPQRNHHRSQFLNAVPTGSAGNCHRAGGAEPGHTQGHRGASTSLQNEGIVRSGLTGSIEAATG